VWDIAKRFGDRTNLLVTNVAQGRDLAKSLRKNNVVLMRGHGFAAAATSLIDVVRMSVYLPRNARVQFRAMQLGRIKPLSKGEIQARTGGTGYKPQSPETQRAWRYWAERAGCADLLKQLS
jgi:HCOMODA/2-hydroxy-3-carboxy-muconic semialdehyde decarboxylase